MTSPLDLEGSAAEAIRSAEAALVRQNSVTAHVDLQVITAVLNAHSTHAEGVDALDRLQQEIEAAVTTWTDLDTPAGARAFQRYLIDKLSAIRSVLDTADLDATSKAALAAALAALYGAAAPGPPDAGSPPAPPQPSLPLPAPAPPDPAPAGIPEADAGIGDPDPSAAAEAPGPPPAPTAEAAAPAPPAAVPAAGWGGGVPGGGLPALPGLSGLTRDAGLTGLADPGRDLGRAGERSDPTEDPAEPAPDPPDEPAPPDGAVVIRLPDGQTVAAPTPELAAVITAAVAGTPIGDAFAQQGIAIPAPGTPVTALVAPDQLIAGDVGVLADRHALALGNGQALLDNRIRPVREVSGPGFLGWQHPPEPQPVPPAAPAPAPTAAPS